MSSPIIGITANPIKRSNSVGEYTSYQTRSDYVTRVIEAGGTPILLPPGTSAEQVIDILDGWLIPGGDDIDPAHYGEEKHPEAALESEDRFNLERDIYQLRDPNMPILGICYGCQFLNVMRGGSLYQHIPDQLGHDLHRGDTVQNYKIDADSQLGEIVGTDASGKSWHHQAIKTVGEGLRVVSQHEDGTIEAVEDESGMFVLGVQWHPERSQSEATPKLFKAFIEQAKKYRESKGK